MAARRTTLKLNIGTLCKYWKNELLNNTQNNIKSFFLEHNGKTWQTTIKLLNRKHAFASTST